MAVVELRLAGNVAQLLNGLDQVNARVDRLEFGANRLQSSFDRTFSFATAAAGAAAFVYSLDRISDSLDKIISRYNVLAGLDRANLFFNSQRESSAMLRGLGDIGWRAEAQSQTNRLLSSEAGKYMDLGGFQTMGEVARGFLLAGETRSIAEGLHAQELYITGGQSRMLHRLGIGVDTPYGYRQYAKGGGIRQADMTGEMRMEARYEELMRAASYHNTARFGAGSESTAFQQIGAISQNVNDSYVRSLAGSIEMLATSLGRLENVNADKVGQVLATLTPLGMGAMATVTTMAGFGSRIVPMQQSLPGLRSQLEDVTQRMGFAQQSASVANLREQTARRMYEDAIQRIVPPTFRAPGGGILPLEDTQSFQYNLAAQSRQSRLAKFYGELFEKEPTEYNFQQAAEFEMRERGARAEGVAIQERYGDVQRRLVGSRLMANGQLLDFEQTAAGSSATGGAIRARAEAENLASAQRMAQAELDQTNRSIASQTRAMAAWVGIEIGIAAVAAGWVAYSNAVQGAERAQQDFLRTAKSGGTAGVELFETQRGGGGLPAMRRQLEMGGMGQDAINQFQAAYRPGMSQGELAALYTQINLSAGREGYIAAEMAGSQADRVLQGVGFGLLGPGAGLLYSAMGIKMPEGRAQIEARYDSWTRGAIAGAPGLAAREAEALAQIEEIEANKQFEALQARISFQQSQMAQFQSAAGGFSPRTPYAEQYQRNIDRMLIGFDPGQLGPAERSQFDPQQRAAIEREVAREKEEESKRIRQNIDAYDKESRARLAVAAIQDQSLGPARRLMDETATEAARRENASQLISAYESALVEGNQALIAEIEARGDLRDALRIQALSGLNLAREMENTVATLRQQIPGLYGEAAGLFQAQVGAQTSIEQGLSSNNPFLSRAQGIFGTMQGLTPQIAQYEQQQALVGAMRAVMNGELPATAAANFGLPAGIASTLLSFAKGDPSSQAAAIAAQESANFGLKRQLITAGGSAIGDLLGFRNSLNPEGGLDPKMRPQIEALYASGVLEQIAPLLSSQLEYFGAEGLINQGTLGRAAGAFGGKLPRGNAVGMVQEARTGLDAVVDQQALLILSLKDLQASVDRLTGAITGQPVPGATTATGAASSGELWGGTVGAAVAAGGFIGGLNLPGTPLPADLMRPASTAGFIPDDNGGFVPARSSDDLFLGIPPSDFAAPAMGPAQPWDPRRAAALLTASHYRGTDRVRMDFRRSALALTAGNIWAGSRGFGRRLYGSRRPTFVGPPEPPGWDGAASGWEDAPFDPSQTDYYGYQSGNAASFAGFETEYYYQPYEKDCGPEG